MRLLEHFVSINGEGLHQGMPTLFLRMAGCNLRCSYCDTKYSHDFKDGVEMTAIEVADIAEKSGVPRVTITGGEPLLQKDMYHLVSMLLRFGHYVEIETNGSVDISQISPHDRLTFTLDYKTPTSGMEDKMLLSNFHFLRKEDCIKFVVGSIEDIDKAFSIYETYKLKCLPILSPVFAVIHPSDIVEHVLKNKKYQFKVQIQSHKVIWPPHQRGV
jgi:7-carboxy-7-deazaguanine synthase